MYGWLTDGLSVAGPFQYRLAEAGGGEKVVVSTLDYRPCMTSITSIFVLPQPDAAGSFQIGLDGAMGLRKGLVVRAGAAMVLQTIIDGAYVAVDTPSTFLSVEDAPPYGAWVPVDAPDGVKDYAISYEPGPGIY